MNMRTVLLDDQAEKALARLRGLTGLSISRGLKEDLTPVETQALQQARCRPYAIYRDLHLGEGCHARAPAGQAKSALAAIIRRKHRP